MLLHARSLAALPGIRHAFFTRRGGVSTGCYDSLNGGIGSDDSAQNIKENRARMAAVLGVAADRLLTAYQIHSPTAVIVEAPWTQDARPRADALVTRVLGIALGVTTADCGPVLFADPVAGVVGAAHAGWRGALAGVTDATIATMEKLGADRTRIRVALGPMIRQQNYEVGPDVVAQLRAAGRADDRFLRPSPRPDHFMFDLAGYIAARLAQAGIGAIEDIDACTYAEPELFFSYRRATHRGEPDYGRHVNAIALA